MDELIEGTGISYRALAMLLLDPSWSGQASIPVAGAGNLTPDGMAEVISDTLGHPVRYRQVPVTDYRDTMLKYGASRAIAQGMADMIEAQNNGIYDAEPRDSDSATATRFANGARTP
jgi:uncharacterized protein YbjT (DUF2867 family)